MRVDQSMGAGHLEVYTKSGVHGRCEAVGEAVIRRFLEKPPACTLIETSMALRTNQTEGDRK